MVISGRVQALAQGIYEEFQNLIALYGPQSITNIMPLVVNVLESLDSSLVDNKDHITALTEVNEENTQLTLQYEKEKAKRKEAESRSVHLEVTYEQELKDLREQNAKLELDSRVLKAKIRSHADQIVQLEERADKLKEEKKELHDRNIECIKSIETFKLARATDTKRSHPPSPSFAHKSPGYEVFAPQSSSRKKRHLPATPCLMRPVGAAAVGRERASTIAEPPSYPASTKEGSVLNRKNTASIHWEQQQALEAMDNMLQVANVEDGNQPSNDGLAYIGTGVIEAVSEDVIADEMGEGKTMGNEGVVTDKTEGDSSSEDELQQRSLFDEMTQIESVSGVDEIISENQVLNSAKNNLTEKLEATLKELRETKDCLDTTKTTLEIVTQEKGQLSNTVREQEIEIKRLKQELSDEQDKSAITGDVLEKGTGPDGTKITRLEVTRLLREKNEFKEKYLSLLEQIRMNDELFMFKKKEKKSRWLDYFTAVFSPAKRRQMEDRYAEASTPRKPILAVAKSEEEPEMEEESIPPLPPGAIGYTMTKIIPTFKKLPRKQEQLYLTSVCWMNPSVDLPCEEAASLQPSTSTVRPLGNHEDHGTILCAAAINPTVHVTDCSSAIPINRNRSSLSGSITSTSLIWVVTGVPNLTRVTVIDAAAMGEVIDTFPVCATPLCCICAIPEFDPHDGEITTGLCSRPQQPLQKASSPGPAPACSATPASKFTTVWMGALDTGELYVHSAVSNWKRSIHADKLKSGVQSIAHLKGKVFVLLKNASVAVYRRFTDGEWNWDSPSFVVVSQKKDIPVTCMSAARSNMWCAVGNCVTIINSRSLKVEATITVNVNKKAEVGQMVSFSDGMWISFKSDSTIRLFHTTSFNHMQDIDIASPIRRVLSFGSEKRSSQMPIYVSTLLATYNSLWVGTENGVVVTFSFGSPVVVSEESDWEVLKAANEPGECVVEPFDIRNEHGSDTSMEIEECKTLPSLTGSHHSSQHLSAQAAHLHGSFRSDSSLENSLQKDKVLSPFCSVDQMQLSIHCHINAVKCLVCVPAQLQADIAYEPLTGAVVDDGGSHQPRTALYILSCGEGHLDLRTADKVFQALQTNEKIQDGQEHSPFIISEKNYVMVWEAIP
ncbi:hypothetical protein EMCRGX_G035046 [Ephydatia muelleri]